ncbi:hypothetical protein FACS1894184_00230 [Clostridia bacterium]|nr:hypothetical protein FACS1894184_00230 [Clostridia bacterium]
MAETMTMADRPREFICIVCPVGCPLKIEGDGEAIKVTGNACSRGETYGKQEYLRPMRVVTSSVAVSGGDKPLVSVKTKGEVDKSRIPSVLAEIRALSITAPVEINQTLVDDLSGTGVALVATSAVSVA